MKFTNEEKDKLLLMHKYGKVVGYAMGYEPPETDNVIITLEEIKECIGKKAETYYYPEHANDFARDLEDAWECLIDELYNQLDTEDETKVYQYLKDKLSPSPTKQVSPDKSGGA